MSRAVMKGAGLHAEWVTSAYPVRSASILATFTYRKGVEPDRNDIKECLRHARQWAKRKGFTLRYVWTAELTKVGKLHYHVLFFLPPRKKLPMMDKAGWWRHGMTRMEWARNAVQYIAKYASKGGGSGRSKFPKGFRLHGCGGLDKDQRNERRYHLAPMWVRFFFTLAERPAPAPGGGWMSRVTGDWQASPYEILSATTGRVVVRVQEWFSALLSQQPITEGL
jgi:hypothetical protein